jgi:hypothetical protein
MKGVFGLKSLSDLFMKLEWEYERLSSEPTNPYFAYNFFVTAWHLIEWKYPDRKDSPIRKKIRDQTPLMQICEHLAVGAKHFEPRSAHLNSVIDSAKGEAWAKGAWKPGAWKDDTWATCLYVALSGDAKKLYGNSLKVQDLAREVMEYWKSNI